MAAAEYRPLIIATYVYELASAFHSFYHIAPVLQAESETMRAARLRLVAAAKQTLINALWILDIETPDRM
jgi:arginyl-tRNA synthetase